MLLLSTAKNFYDFGFGFIEYMYEFINLDSEQKRETQISYYLKTIYENKELLEIINEKAIKRQISLDSMIYLDARWLADRELEILFPKEMN